MSHEGLKRKDLTASIGK